MKWTDGSKIKYYSIRNREYAVSFADFAIDMHCILHVIIHVSHCRYWSDYEAGFGDLTGNHWLGLTKLARLTASGPVQLHVYLEAFDAGDWAYALYDSFQITDASDDYRLSVSGYSGTAGNAMDGSTQSANGMRFTTRDRDNDVYGGSCAEEFSGSWWYRACHHANLNGLYLGGAHASRGNGINWKPYKDQYYSLKTTIMKIKPVN